MIVSVDSTGSGCIVQQYLLKKNSCVRGFTVVKNLPDNAGEARDEGLIPGSGRSPGVGNGNPLQCSCLQNPLDRVSWWATVHGVTELDITEPLHTHTHK